MDYDDKKLQEHLASLKSNDISALRAELIVCLDEDQFGHDEPQTLALSKYLDEKTQGRIFEEDDGYLDFTLQMTRDTIRKVKARLRMNFSHEKLEFATKIIAFLKQSEQKSDEQLLVETYHITDAIYHYQEIWDGNTYHYIYTWHEPMERQLYTAGIRLAQLLNKIYK